MLTQGVGDQVNLVSVPFSLGMGVKHSWPSLIKSFSFDWFQKTENDLDVDDSSSPTSSDTEAEDEMNLLKFFESQPHSGHNADEMVRHLSGVGALSPWAVFLLMTYW